MNTDHNEQVSSGAASKPSVDEQIAELARKIQDQRFHDDDFWLAVTEDRKQYYFDKMIHLVVNPGITHKGREIVLNMLANFSIVGNLVDYEIREDLRKAIDDPKTIDNLLKRLQEPTTFLDEDKAAQVLGYLEEQRAVEPLSQIIKHEIQERRKTSNDAGWEEYWEPTDLLLAATVALGNIGDKQAVELLIQIIKIVRMNRHRHRVANEFDVSLPDNLEQLLPIATMALGRLGGDAAVTFLSETLHSRDEEECSSAAFGLVSSEDTRVVGPLLATLESPFLIVEAAEVLGRVGDPRAIKHLAQAFDKAGENYDFSSEGLCQTVILTLEDLAEPDSIPHFSRWLANPKHEKYHEKIISTLKAFGSQAQPDLIKLYKMDVPQGEELLSLLPPHPVGQEFERLLFFDDAIKWYNKFGLVEEAAAARKKQLEMGAAKVSQKVVQGDEITTIQDSVLNRSPVSTGGSSLMAELEKLVSMKKKGLLTEEEFQTFKKKLMNGQ